jgi:hypothetical protein
MTRQVLIDNIFRQTTVLIAQLATSGGVRAPLAQLADRVFLDLARELDQQGISRKVSADMFGMALRSYRHIDCTSLGFTGCDIDEAIGHYGCIPILDVQ